MDRDTLIYQEYICNNKSREDVAKLLGISKAALISYLYRHKIKKIPKYTDKEWLENKYVTEKLSAGEIALSLSVARSTICTWLYKYNIPIRDKDEQVFLSTRNTCYLDSYIRDFIYGELLGDGTLVAWQ